MKKICLVLMSLSLTLNGYSQISKVSSRDALVPSQMQMITRFDEDNNLQNVQKATNMLRTDGELDYSTYDWQTNAAAKNWTMTFPDGCVGFSYVISSNTAYSDRGTNIVIYNPTTETWTTSGGKIENHKTGFGCAARYGQNGIVVVSRNPNTSTCEVYIIQDKNNLPYGNLSPIYTMNSSHNPHFPTVMCTGPNHDHIHILITALDEVSSDGQKNPYYYIRSMDGGQTWSNFMTIDYLGCNYVSTYGSGQDAYFIENTGGNELNIVVNTRRGDGSVLTSTDEGNTWSRTVFYHHPGINTNFGDDGIGFLYPRWTSVLKDNQSHLQMVYEFGGSNGDVTSTSYYPGIGGVAFWSETMPYRGYGVEYGFDPTNPIPPVHGQPFIMDTAYLNQDIYRSWWRYSDATHEMWPEYVGYLPALTNGGEWEDPYSATEFNIDDYTLHGTYNSGCVAFPVLCKVPGTNGLVAVWSAMDENNIDGNGKYYYKLFASYSSNGGLNWSNMVHLTNNFMYEFSECVYPQAAITNNQLIIAVQMDGTASTYVLNSEVDTNPYDNYYQGLTFDLQSLFGITPTQNYSITATANPTNGGTVTGAGTYAQGSTCTLHASANSGYSFVKWTKNGTQVSTNPNYSFTVTGDAAYVAHFQQNTTNYTITATASPSNAGTITGAGSYASGSTCTLRATPNSGYTFVNWLENGTSVSTNATYSFTVTGNRNLVAVFDVAPTNYTITATANPSNGGSVDGGGTYASGSICTLRATANSGYTFVNWTKNGTQVSTNPNYSFTVTGNASYVANFEQEPEEYSITVNAEPANGGTVSGGGTYTEGSTCVISAMPNDGYVFDNWTRNGTVVSTEPTYSIVVNRNLTFVAHFAQNANQATITAMAEPVEGGSVSGGGTYELGSNCTLNAVAAVGYEFVNWTLNGSQVSTDASFSFTITGNAVYVAHFSKIVNHYSVSANVQPANAGSVIGAGTYEEGASCTLIAIANPTYTFVSWTENGAVVSTDEQYTFTVERDRNLVAVFSQGLFYTITASAGGNGSITPEGEIMVNPGEDKTFAIIPNSGCRVSKVLVDGVDVGPVESYTFRSVNANHSIRAQFSGLGVDDNPMHGLKVYPNPANEMLNIEGNDIKRIAVFDLLGVQLADKEINDDQAILPTSNFAQGTYILKVEFEDGSVGYSRFVVAR